MVEAIKEGELGQDDVGGRLNFGRMVEGEVAQAGTTRDDDWAERS